ncbi:MAG: response regulator [Deltaproteobacteria bacterium]|nr:response regulator [Deltaproteobacteria bacterium]
MNASSPHTSASQVGSKELEVLYHCARSVLESVSFDVTAREIFDSARKLTGAKSGYVALLSVDGMENEVLFLESGGLPCTVDESLPMPIRGLREVAYRLKKTVCENDFMHSEWLKFMPPGHVDLRNVMFAPLCIGQQTVGIIGLANKDGDFSDEDLRVAGVMGDLAAIALNNSRNQHRLRENEAYLRSLFDNMTTGVAVYDAIDNGNDFRLLDLNAIGQVYSRINISDARGKRVTELFPAVVEMGLLDRLRQCYRTGEPQHLPHTLYEDGRLTQWVENRTFRLPSGLVVAMFDDRTEQRALEQRLQQSEKMQAIGVLAGGIAHDFNNILGAILGYGEMLASELSEEPVLSQYVSHILQSVDRAKNMVYQILSFSRQSPGVKSPQYIRPVIKEAVLLLRGSLPSGIRIDTRLEREQAPVIMNSTQIHEVLLNLCTNASHAVDETGCIQVTLSNKHFRQPFEVFDGELPAGPYSVFCVSDDGVGIPGNIHSKIFEPFFTTKKEGKGTGMGLSVVFGIVKDHGGGITLTSVENEGTCFCIYLPQTEVPVERSENSSVTPRNGTESIMIVDDEAVLCDMMTASLRKAGYMVHRFTDGLLALEAFSAAPDDYDLVITDQTMPGISGLSLAKEIRRIRSDCHVIMCTGYSNKVNEQVCSEHGIKKLFYKPVRLRELTEAIRQIFDSNKSP